MNLINALFAFPAIKNIIVPGLAAVLALLGFSACSHPVNTAYRPPITADVIEKAVNSLNYEVLDFKWAYTPDGRRLRVTGTVRNNTDRAGAAFIYALMFDEDGLGTALGEGQIHPRRLAPGATGSFTILANTNRPQNQRPIRHLRLLTNTQPE